MLHACAARFDVTENLENFLKTRPKKTWQEQDGAGRLYQVLEIPSPFCLLLPLWTCGEDSAAASFPMPEPGTAAAASAADVRTDIG